MTSVTDGLTFKLNDEFIESYRDRPVDWGFKDAGGNSLGEITFLRTYSRLKPDGTKERWYETCRRVVEGMFSIQKDHVKENRLSWNDHKAQVTAQDAYERLFTFKWTPPGRGLWMMGTPLVNVQKNSAALQNCAFISTNDMTKLEPAGPFAFLMEASMLGVGVGFDGRGAGKGFTLHEPLADKAWTYVVEDSREGWVQALVYKLESYLIAKRGIVTLDVSKVRPAGQPIALFGGTAAGPGPLVRLMKQLDRVLGGRDGQQLDTKDIADIGNLIGVCVVSGNVRRSAELYMGSMEDTDFLNLKNYDIFPERNTYSENPDETGWGWMSNNSVSVQVGQDLSPIIDGIARNGEPGVIYMDLARQYGRMIDPPNEKDSRVAGFNPCQPGWAPILTPEGLKPLSGVIEGDLIWSESGWTTVVKKWSNGIKPVNAYITRAGTFYGTKNHRLVSHGAKVDAQHCKAVDVLRGPRTEPMILEPLDIMDGLVFGDGMVHKASDDLILLCIGKKDFDYHNSEVSELILKDRHRLSYAAWEVKTSILAEEIPKTYERCIPDRFYYAEPSKVAGFLRGLYSANGSIVRNRVTLKASSREVILRAQQMLSSLGIRSSYTIVQAHENQFSNGVYTCKQSYDLNISVDVPIFAALIGFIQQDKKDRLQKVLDRRRVTVSVNVKSTYEIREVEYISDEEVFDITVDNSSHTYWTGALNVSNCAEQQLESGEMCTLVETYLNRHESLEDFKKTLKVAYLYGKTVTLLPTHWPKTNAIMQRNRRIGASVSGIANFTDKNGLADLRVWLDAGYNVIKKYDVTYSEWLCIRESVRMTTVKPSGTVSILAGESPGVHWSPGAEYFNRSIRFGKDDAMVTLFRAAGYRVEVDVSNPETTVVVFFPIHSPALRSEKDVTLFEKANLAVVAQRYWSDNSVSVTLSFDAETEAKHVPTILHMHDGQLKTVSFLPMGNKVYPQMPYSSISVEEYQTAAENLLRVPLGLLYDGDMDAVDAIGESFCSTDACILREDMKRLEAS